MASGGAHFLDRGKSWAQDDLGLDRRLGKAVAKLGFIYPTLVQAKCIPLALQGRDLLVRARTGSGKTAAYALPLLHKILGAKDAEPGLEPAIRAVVLVPTRELCAQVGAQLRQLTHYCLDVVSVLALVDDNTSVQQAQLRDRPDVLVATPARLVTHLRAGNVALRDTVETLVVDEADLVLSFGYADDIRTVMAGLPKVCQSFLMSATLSRELEDLKRVVLHRPATLKLEEGAGSGRLAQFYLPLGAEADKPLVLFALLRLGLLEGKGLFFVNSVDACYRLKLFLDSFFVRSAVLNAELPLNSRLHILQEFNRDIFDYLIVTDGSLDVTTAENDGGGAESEMETDAGTDEEEEEREESEVEEASGEEATAKAVGRNQLVEGDDSDDDDDSSSNDDGAAAAVANGAVKAATGASATNGAAISATGTKRKQPGSDGGDKNASGGGGGGKGGIKGRCKQVDAGYGVARGVDFQGVSFVVNVDVPPTPHSYTHRIGRTARGGASGTALTLIVAPSPAEQAALAAIQASQPLLPEAGGGSALEAARDVGGTGGSGVGAIGGDGSGGSAAQPAPLAFDTREIEQFRYRVEDVWKRVTRIMVREARAAEIKAEMINSDKLKEYFRDNPDDLRVLRHDKTLLHPLRRQEHLKHIPSYLMPAGLATGDDPALRQRSKRRRAGEKRRAGQGQDPSRRKDNDPLQSFNAGALAGVQPAGDGEGGGGGGSKGGGKGGGGEATGGGPRGVMQKGGNLGVSTSGRRQWQERHKKGKASKSYEKHKQHKKKGTRFDLPF